nr:hypothetical protein [uncultured Romboutsia sp.]
MKKWERNLTIASVIIGIIGIIVTCVSIAQTSTAGNECVEPVNQIIILGDVIVADAEVVKSKYL